MLSLTLFYRKGLPFLNEHGLFVISIYTNYFTLSEDEVEQWDDNISNKSLMERRAQQEIKRKKLDYISKLDKSIFFPTFRRIEGGYNSSTNLYLRRRFHEEEIDEVKIGRASCRERVM